MTQDFVNDIFHTKNLRRYSGQLQTKDARSNIFVDNKTTDNGISVSLGRQQSFLTIETKAFLWIGRHHDFCVTMYTTSFYDHKDKSFLWIRRQHDFCMIMQTPNFYDHKDKSWLMNR